jgi:hypothetical protein
MPQEIKNQRARLGDLLAAVLFQRTCSRSRVERVEFERSGRSRYAEEIIAAQEGGVRRPLEV